MAVEFFFVPMVGTGTRQDPYAGKYQEDPAVESAGHIRYSRTSVCVMGISAAQTFIDIIKNDPETLFLCIETDLSENIGGQQSVAIKSFLEPLGVPANWISAADTYVEVLRGIIGMFMFTQRHEGLNSSGFFEDLETAGFGLNTQWQGLTQSFRDTIQATIDDHNWPDTPGQNDQVRKILRDFADKWTNETFHIGGVEI